MTPKEKARQLVHSFTYLNSNKMSDYSRIEHPTAKVCALMVVDEIERSREEDVRFDDSFLAKSQYHTAHPMYSTYWKEVREEIENL